MKNTILIGQAEEIDLLQPQVRAMLGKEGVYIGGDTKNPDLLVPLVSQGGKVFCLAIDHELAPDRFLDTLTLHGPYVPQPPAPTQGLSESEIASIAGGCMETGRYNMFMALIRDALRTSRGICGTCKEKIRDDPVTGTRCRCTSGAPPAQSPDDA